MPRDLGFDPDIFRITGSNRVGPQGPEGATGATGASGAPGADADISDAYPVDTVYISAASANPSVAFGFGTWAAITPTLLTGYFMWRRTA